MIQLILVVCVIWSGHFAIANIPVEDSGQPICSKEQAQNCWLTDDIVYGRKLACRFNVQVNRSQCMYSADADIDTLEISGNGFITIFLKRFQLIYPTVQTFILRDSSNPVELGNILFFNTRVKNLVIINSKVLFSWNTGILPGQIETISGLSITSEDFRLQDLSLNNLRYLKVSTEPGIEHKQLYFSGVYLTELHYNNQQIAQFLWTKLPESLDNLETLSLTCTNTTIF